MVTKIANARRKAFLDSKKEYGDIEQMTKAFHKSKFTVWFDDNGDIKCCSKEPNEVFDKKFNSKYLFVSDGKKSQVKEFLKLEENKISYNSTAYVFEFSHSKNNNNDSIEHYFKI